VKGSIGLAIFYLKEKSYKRLIKELAAPQDLEKLKKLGKSVDEVAEALGGKPGEVMATILNHIKDKEPTYLEEDGLKRARFAVPESVRKAGLARDHVDFVEINGKWYMTE
jgi:hypothetical protein